MLMKCNWCSRLEKRPLLVEPYKSVILICFDVRPPLTSLGRNLSATTLSVSPSTKAMGTVEAHLIPSLNLGITALNGAVEAKVSLELDAASSTKLDLGVTSKTLLPLNPPGGCFLSGSCFEYKP